MRYELEVISPLNIGNGTRIKDFEYFFRNGRVEYIDIYKLIKDISKSSIKVDYLISSFDRVGFRWDEVKERIGLKSWDKYISVVLEASGITNVRGEIVPVIRSAGRPYIPGSSIKGALRCSITRGIWRDVGMYYREQVDYAIREKNNNLKYRLDPQKLDDIAEEKVFGKPHNSPFRYLKISDSDILSNDSLNIYEVKIMNICNDKIKWFSLNKNHDRSQEALSIYIEAFKRGTKTYGSINSGLDKKIYDSFIITEGKIVNYEIIKMLKTLIGEDIKRYIEEEIAFFMKYGPSEIVDFYKDIKIRNDKLKENEIMIQVGFATGYLSKTIGNYLNKGVKDIEKLRLVMPRTKVYTTLFPKTRRIIFRNGKPDCVPGWIKLTFEGW
ncbi:CRISPR-associated protein, Csm5 family [Caldanaerobius fijiensis DSM 17918]|uniref:CRISPR system Cms protein Csm5 n=1 Tax=Caldanaerobius fijiensis DSM 17918 TaxID=1121256 RepID=A0A1M4SLF8_9THEO|nr:type III-A CRISPR-associated RAMP protein Csm5 [Caldanaerobius fijiensis]SHE33114.1 CRISPR-associated protein, Csm5 family [Caldanaerobius fijiensis DSM 17918]